MADQTMSPPALAGKWTTGEIASDPRVGFLLALGRASHAAGHHSQTLEDLLDRTAARLGVTEAQFFTTPTSIFAAFGAESTQRTYLIRVEPGGPDLGRLVRIEEILEAVLAGRLTPLEGAGRLRDVAVSAAPRGPLLTTIAFALSSAASAVFLGGGAKEVALAGALGLLTGALALLARHAPALGRIFSAAASFVVALLAGVIGALGLDVSVSTATLAGLIVLLPGLMIVSAMRELATGHLSSGTARAAGSFIVLIGIGFGVALGTRAAELLAGPAAHVAALPLPAAGVWIAVVVSAVGFTILLHADWRDAAWIVLGAAVALLATRAGGRGLGPSSRLSWARSRWRWWHGSTRALPGARPRWCWPPASSCWSREASASEASPPCSITRWFPESTRPSPPSSPESPSWPGCSSPRWFSRASRVSSIQAHPLILERAMRTRLRRFFLVAPLFLGTLPLTAQTATRTVVVVRHAEKGAEGTDPSLTPAGAGRAEALSRVLEDVKVTALFATEYKRTQETVQALEKRLGLAPTIVPARAVDSLVARIQALPPGAAAVVASHSNLVHVIVQRLSGVSIPELTEADYDRMAVVTMTGPGQGTVVVLRYGAPSAAGPQAPMVKP